MDNNILRQDYLPGYLEPYLRDNGLHGTIAVQARQVAAKLTSCCNCN